MSIRQSVANQLAAAAKAVENNRSKEKAAAAITEGRRKLAKWISPDKFVATNDYIVPALVRVIS